MRSKLRWRKRVCGLKNAEFSELMRQYQRLVYTVCLQFVHDPHTAEDLTQDTFVTAFSSIDRCDPAYHKQWLVRVAANKCKDHLKSAWVRKVETHEDDTLPEPTATPPPGTSLTAPPPDPEQDLIERDGAKDIADLIRALRQPYTPVAVMYLLEEKTVPEIAQILGRPAATVQNQLFRAKVLLRKQITERRQE